MRLVVRTRAVEDPRPLLELLPTSTASAFVHDDEGLVGWGEALRTEPGPGPDRIPEMSARLRDLVAGAEIDDTVGVAGSGLAAFVSATFDPRSRGSVLIVPRLLVGRRDGATFLTRVTVPGQSTDVPPPATSVPAPATTDRIRYAGSSVPDIHWLEAVAAAIEAIDADRVGKVVLARDHAVWSREPFEARSLARRLHARFPGCFTFLVDGLIGASPELLVRRLGTAVESVTLAGTVARGGSAEEDAALGRKLLGSDKDRREHGFAVASVRDVLGPRTRELDWDDDPVLLQLANVHHLATRFEGRLVTGETALDVADALHPTAAVGGAPTAEALALIAELEGMDRGRYAGPVGWVDGRGDGELAIALRCGELSGARARLFAGAGIVAGSLPEDELEETRIKLRAMQSALDPTASRSE